MRTFEFDVDRRHTKKVNETVADVRRLRVSALIFAAILAGVAYWVGRGGQTWELIVGGLAGLGALGCVWISFWAPRRVGPISDMYRDGPLVPAIVAEVRPRGATLLALVDVAKPEAERAHPALVTRNVRSLPGHRLEVGERVPSVAILADRSRRGTSDTWQLASPMPLAWGTPDMAVVRSAEDKIDEPEWQLLTANVQRAELARRSTDGRIELTDDELPDSLRTGDDAHPDED